MRFVPPRVHGVLDYLFAGLFIVAPFWFGFVSRVAQLSSFAFGGAILLLSLLTRYPLGVLRVIPFPVHGGIELVSSVALIALPWLGRFGDTPVARNFFVATGVILFGLWLTTDYKAAEQDQAGAWRRGLHGRA
ncbi:SPW repeat domain-containing protein [Nannocystis pusilla]|uniref:SPW repeat-containing integral membrane domain-containing protein n=1 Tax=Nannocystis pusilla TaxID=889268 RepID=A0ABS7U5X2_9BACT|nr:hypothetical protein [Nannocystis pusilla]MBZ5715950.1 hypothetical protein [Nannocystis pusilla]